MWRFDGAAKGKTEEEKRAERDGAKENKENVEQDVEEKLRENKN